MKLYITRGAMGQRIDEEKTQWCCTKFKDAPHYHAVYDGDVYIGEEPDYIFNWEKYRFEKVNDGIMMGCGGFGDRFWGDKITKCPFCGTNLKRIQFYINGERTNAKEVLKFKL